MSANNMELIELLDRKIDSFQKKGMAGIPQALEVLITLQNLRKEIVSLNQVTSL